MLGAMLYDVGMVLAGLLMLVAGAEGLVRGASTLALAMGVRPAVIGLTVVAWGTSFPELVISVDSALRDMPDIAVANVVGSNVYNVALILGLTGLVSGLRFPRVGFRVDVPAFVLSAGLVVVLVQDLELGLYDGILLLAGLVTVTAAWLVQALREPRSEAVVPGAGAIALAVVGCFVGIVLLGVGARAFTSGAVSLAETWGVSRRVIGLTLVALGTSLPELFTSLVAAARGQADIAVSNVIGSNILNSLGILGVTACVAPIAVNPAIVNDDLWWMAGITLLLVPLLWTGSRLARVEGLLLLTVGAVYTYTLL